MVGAASGPGAGTGGVSGVILAGGRSRRLGIDKTTMPWPPPTPGEPAGEGVRTLLQATGATLEAVCDEVLVVAYRGQPPLPYRVVPDLYQDGGSLGGIYSGLSAAACGFALAVATDMPFLSLPLLRWMLAQPRDYDVLLPVSDRPQPLHAVYGKACLEPLRRRLEAGRLRISDFLAEVRVREVPAEVLQRYDPEGLSFFNVNTPDDLDRARAILARG
jgi:molybdopterin-guanine dinucleotide biosynthesis protein A